MEFPDDILGHIKGFAKPKLRTKHQWIDFYLERTEPLRYKVGMQFKILGAIHTIISITSETIITHGGISELTFHPLNDITYFRYRNLEIHNNFHWKNMVNASSSLKKRQFITHTLLYIKTLFYVQNSPFSHFTQKIINILN